MTKSPTGRSTVLAFSRFKKIAGEYATVGRLSFQLTRDAHVELQQAVESLFKRLLAVIVRGLPPNRCSITALAVRRARNFLDVLLQQRNNALAALHASATRPHMPKRLAVRSIKARWPKVRVTSGAIDLLAFLYTDIITLALGYLSAPGKRLLPPDLRTQLSMHPCFAQCYTTEKLA